MNVHTPDSCPTRHVAVGIVTYAPGAPLLDRLRLAAGEGYDVFLFDNSPEREDLREAAVCMEGCHYHTAGKNLGLGVGISAVCAMAYFSGHSALVFFDQDTVFDTSTLDHIDRFAAARQGRMNDHAAVVFNARDGHVADPTTVPVHDVDFAISSGTLFFLPQVRRIGWHNEHYFVDCVDYEFCARARRFALRIAECRITPGFDHLTEQPDRVVRLFGRNHAVRRYASWRVRGTAWASLRLAITCAITREWRSSGLMLRSLAIYLSFQLLARLLPTTGPQPSAPR